MKTENKLETINSFHADLKLIKELVYDKCGFTLTNPQLNKESAEYAACSFDLDGNSIQHRISKITPKKTGQFVTIWKRDKDGIIKPFDVTDDIDFIVITARSGNRFGQFIFPKRVLADKGIITQNEEEGKRGIRVYPPWDNVNNEHAEKSKSWQTKYFLIIKNDNSTDLDLAKKLFAKTNEPTG